MFTIIVTRHNGHVFTTDADSLGWAKTLAEGHVGPSDIGWMATILDPNGREVGTYRWGAVVAKRGWAA